MCANFDNLKDEVIALDYAGTDIFHIDIMDGSFVPNMALGPQDVECIRNHTKKLVDCHLMVTNPSQILDIFLNLGVDIIYVHPETDVHIVKTLGRIKAKKRFAGIALNPGTSIESVIELLPLVDYIMVMTVNPGFAGQSYLEFVNHKIERLVALKNQYNYKVMVDGAISPQKIDELSLLGVDGFILGTSALFGKDEDYKTIIHRLKGKNNENSDR